MENKYTVLIFFEKENLKYAENIEKKLFSEDIEVRFADDSFADGLTAEEFAVRVQDVYEFIFLLTATSLEKGLFKEEINFAVQNGKKAIPVMLEEFKLEGGIKSRLSNVQHASVGADGAEALLSDIADQIKSRIEKQKTMTYGVVEFLGRKALYELGKLCKKATENFKKRNKSKFFITTSGVVTTLVTCIFIYWALSQSYFWLFEEKMLMSIPPVIPGLIITFLSRFIFGRIKNPILITVLSLITIALVFVAVMFTGFGISVYLQL